MRGPVTVVIPALNEEAVIGRVIEQIAATLSGAWIPHEILVVDDGSTDRTAAIAAAHGARVLSHPYNLGYGRSLKDGICAASHETILITDADGTYPIERFPDLIAEADTYHMVVGARRGREYKGTPTKRFARLIFKLLSEFTTGRSIPDINSGLRVFRRGDILPFFPQISSGFSFTTTVTLAYMLNDLLVHYVPVAYHKRAGQSKVRYFRDTLRALQIIVQAILQYNPIKVFLILACPFYAFSGLALLGAAALWSPLLFGMAFGAFCTGSLIFSQGLHAAAAHRPAADASAIARRAAPVEADNEGTLARAA
jgi:glycosyltransferase involved in cell wall biosynthesis